MFFWFSHQWNVSNEINIITELGSSVLWWETEPNGQSVSTINLKPSMSVLINSFQTIESMLYGTLVSVTLELRLICAEWFVTQLIFAKILAELYQQVILKYDAKLLTDWTLEKMAAIWQTTFSWEETFVFWLKFQWILFLWIQLTISQHLFR